MSDDTKDSVDPSATPPAGEPSAPAAREPWATPRVLAAEPFDRTEAGMDGFPAEGFFYGPS